MTQSLRSGETKARKDYECDLCHLKILSGTKHYTHAVADDGTCVTWRYHLICESKTHDWDDDDFATCITGADFRQAYGITQEIIDGGQLAPQTDNPTLSKAEV